MGRSKRNMPNKFEIASYWKDRKINGYEMVSGFENPHCMACRNYIKYDHKFSLSIKDRWNASENELERCHIIPKALGGSDDASNLVLMCHYCHKESPDTINTDYFFNWIINRTWQDAINEYPEFKTYQILKTEGYSKNDVIEFFKKLNNEEIVLPEDVINTHCFTYSNSTIEYYYVHMFKEYISQEV